MHAENVLKTSDKLTQMGTCKSLTQLMRIRFKTATTS